MAESSPAPLTTYTGAVLPEWIDYNGHMMDGYYFVAFTYATEGFLDHMGFGPKYREATGSTIYTVEGHINFLREVKAGSNLRFSTQLLDYDSKRLHVFHYMHNDSEGYLAATSELMFLHFNQRLQKVESMPADRLEQVAGLYEAQRGLPRPPQAGRSIGIQRRSEA